MSKYAKETKLIAVTDEAWKWTVLYPDNKVQVSISANHIGDSLYIKLNAWGMDDFGVEIEHTCHSVEHLMEMYEHFKHYIYDKIMDGVDLNWFYEHGFVDF